jgi:metacaspase-1
MQHKRAICIGINDYPGYINDLKGCVADAKAWGALLVDRYEFEPPIMILDSMATIERVTNEVNNLIKKSEPGDVLVWTYSGHGTSVPGVRPDKPNGRSEAICLYNGLLLDTQIKNILSNLKNDIHMTVVSDSCFSGTLTRLMQAKQFEKTKNKLWRQPRYMPPSDDLFALQVEQSPVTDRVFSPEEDMIEILISGCSSTETSSDAYIQEGVYMGAMSYFALNILRGNPTFTYKEFYKQLRQYLPNGRYSQTPQLEGNDKNKERTVFS